MSFDLSDFSLRDILHTAKQCIENDYFKITVDNVDYPAIIPRVGVALIDITIYCMKRQVNNENPIEKMIIEFNDIKKEEGHDYLLDKYGNNWDVDFLDSEKFFLRPNLHYLFEESSFECADVNEKTKSYLINQMQKGEIVCLTSSDIGFGDLKNSNYEFEEKLKNFLYEKCIKEYNNNESLQNALINIKEKRIQDEKEKEKHMRLVREKEHKIQEYNENLEVPKRKNLKDYNIR